MATLHPYPTPSCYLISSESKNRICFQIQLASLFKFKLNDIEKRTTGHEAVKGGVPTVLAQALDQGPGSSHSFPVGMRQEQQITE